MLARQFGVNNFFMGSLRGLDAGLFTTVFSLQPLTSRHDKKIANNTVMPILPPDSDPLESTAEAQKLRSRFPKAEWVLCWSVATDQGIGSPMRIGRRWPPP